MKLLSDILPVIIFFIVYKFYGIYLATTIAIITALSQLTLLWLIKRELNKTLLMNACIITVLGGATLWLHNDMFIKWKPSVINWAFALVFAGSQFIGKKSVIERMMEHSIKLPKVAWYWLNWSWVGFFTLIGFLNLYVIYHFSTDDWVNFKLFGILGLTFLFAIGQALCLAFYTRNQT